MRIFLIWAGKGPEIKSLMLRLKEQGHEIIYWVGSTGGEEDKLPETIFHEHAKALAGVPASGIDMAEFPLPSRDLIKEFYRAESIILTMMNKQFSNKCVDERRHLYYRMLQYWYGVIKKYKPEAIIFPIIPHTVYDYLIYELARFLNIKTITFEDTWVSDRLMLYTDFWQGNVSLQKEIQENADKKFVITDLSVDLQRYYQRQMEQKNGVTPSYIKDWREKYKFFNKIFLKIKIIIKSIKDLSIFRKSLLYIGKLLGQNIKKEYYNLQRRPDFNKKFIYFPLHFQPEQTTSPQGDMFVDQLLAVEILAASLPDNWFIYVKEHPVQWLLTGLNFTSARYQGYYRKMAQLKNVILVSIKTDTFQLINNSQAVATIAGTAGWEAILRSKPAIIFGNIWYRDCPGVFNVDSVEICEQVFKKIKDGFKIKQQKVINYLYSFDKATIRGYIEAKTSQSLELTKQENIDNIIKAILIEIEKQ